MSGSINRLTSTIVVAGLIGKSLPILPTERQYLVTDSVPELGKLGFELPILRDYDVPFYFRQERDSLIILIHGCAARSAISSSSGPRAA